MPRSLRYDEPYLLDERAASPIRHSGIRWGIGLVRFRRYLVVRARLGERPLTTRLSRSSDLVQRPEWGTFAHSLRGQPPAAERRKKSLVTKLINTRSRHESRHPQVWSPFLPSANCRHVANLPGPPQSNPRDHRAWVTAHVMLGWPAPTASVVPGGDICNAAKRAVT
jgi:hypothetical protein